MKNTNSSAWKMTAWPAEVPAGDVAELQRFLNRRGLGPIEVTGTWGVETDRAFERYGRARLQMGVHQTTASNLPSGPTAPVSAVKVEMVKAAPLPAPPAPVPLWKRPEVIGGAAVALLLWWWLRRRK